MKHRQATKTTHYHYTAHRIDSVSYDDALSTVYHYNAYGQPDSVYDESGVMCYEYGNMGEVTKETRIYALPLLPQPLALSTLFEYDSWGRILNITYPDNEIVNYDYDLGGQLFRMYNNSSYNYLDNIIYDKFGAKISQDYGNGIQTKYTYYPLTQRLDSLLTTYGGNTLSYLQYTYDSVGNIIVVNSSYPMPQYQVTERYSYDSADQLLTAESTCNNNVLCSGAYSYNNWGKINTYTQQTTDPATNISENKDYRYYFPSNSSDMAQGQTSFAPIIKYDMQQNPQPLETCTYGINGSIRKRYDHPTQNTDYYYFNASGNLKACGTDMQISVYGYNSANTRTYKVNLFNANQWVNGQPQPIQPMVQNAMFYPNTYINFNQGGDYTKHYYNGTERIASRLGEQQVPVSLENEQELEAYKQDVKQIIYNAIGQHLYDEPTDMQEGDVIPLEFLQVTGDNNALFYYHPNHLSSTMYVTDAQQSVVQSFLYAPYGEIISEYNTHVMGEAFPKYSFNAKELDEETGMYYYEARYYAPPTFISRDPLMSEKPWLTPYHYCSNNPVGRIDPSGMFDKENQAERSRNKAIKQYGENRVSKIQKSESGQYYYDIFEKDEVKVDRDGDKIKDGQIVFYDVIVKSGKGRSVYSKNAYKYLVEKDMRDGQLEKSFSFRAKKSAQDFEEKFDKVAYSVVSGAALYNPLIGVPNDCKTLFMGEDIYGNSATTVDRLWATAGIATFGSSRALRKACKTLYMSINIIDGAIDTRSAYKTCKSNSRKNK